MRRQYSADIEGLVNGLLRESGNCTSLRVSPGDAIYRGQYSYIYKVRIPGTAKWRALKVFLDGAEHRVDAGAASSYVRRVEILRSRWPEHGRVTYPKTILDLSWCGIVIMDWINARPLGSEVKRFPVRNLHLHRLTRMAAMWLRTFHFALSAPIPQQSDISIADIYTQVLSLAPEWLSSKRRAGLERFFAAAEQAELFDFHEFVQEIHGDFGIYNILVSGRL